MLDDPILTATNEWTFSGDGIFDQSVSRTNDGSGSFRLQTRYGQPNATTFFSNPIPVTPGKTYTFSVYMKSGVWPCLISIFMSNHDASGTYIENSGGSRWGNSGPDVWEECMIPYTPKSGVSYTRLKILRVDAQRNDGHIWIDEIYFGERFGLREPPTPKVGFTGHDVRFDALGNIEVYRDTSWIPFFPLCIHSDNQRALDFYSEQGWNCNIWAASASKIQEGKDAVSVYNPQGIVSAMALSPYVLKQGWAAGDVSAFRTRLQEIKDQGLFDYLLMYYWDNENDHEAWEIPLSVIDTAIREIDGDAQHARNHPVYILQGNYGVARIQAGAGISDLVGCYEGGGGMDGGAAGSGNKGLFIQDRTAGQPNPAAIAQFNGVRDAGEMRKRIYNSIINGARGMAYWRDCYNPNCQADWGSALPPIDQFPWWDDFPNLRVEIDSLIPVIRSPHWTSWEVTGQYSGQVSWGTREVDGQAYIILVNNEEKSNSVTFDLSEVPYAVVSVVNYFSGNKVADVSGNSVTIDLPALAVGQGTMVLWLKPESDQIARSGNNNNSFVIKCFPNPFSHSILIKAPSQFKNIKLAVYNIKGELINRINPNKPWKGLDSHGRLIPSGLYLIRMVSGNIRKQIQVFFIN
jgi:hypothetical protein